MRSAVLILAMSLALAACGDSEAATSTSLGPDNGELCADVVGVVYEATGEGVYRFEVTVSSADTGWDKYADAWEVRAPDGSVLAVRELTHPHETEQPFTRSLAAVEIPAEISDVTVVARDSVEGFCGEAMTVSIR